MGMSLEQVIADCEEEISDCQIDLDGIQELLDEYPERKAALAHDIDDYKKRMDYNRQLAEWLKELVERRKLPEIVKCKDCEKHNKRFDEYPADEACPLTVWRVAQEHEFDYQFCAYAERRTDATN